MNNKYDEKYPFFDGSRFVERLKKITNKNQRQIADDLEKAPSIISEWANGRRVPSTEDIITISKIYKCSIDYLLGIYDMHTKELSLSDICRYLMEIDKVQDLHIKITDLLDGNKAGYKSRVTMCIAPKAKNDHKTEALINLINGYIEICNMSVTEDTKKDLLNTLVSRLDKEASEKEYRAIVDGVFRKK